MKEPDEGLRDELRSLSPFLASLHEKDRKILPPPPGYFDKLPDEIMSTIRALSPSAALKHDTASRKRPAFPGYRSVVGRVLAFASLAGLIFAGGNLLRPKKAEPTNCAGISCLNAAEVQEYIQYNIHNFPLDVILEAANAEAALNTLFIPVPSPGNEALEPVFNELFQQMDAQEYESLF